MRVAFLLLAEYINNTSDGRVNVMGIFDHLHVTTFPARHAMLNLIIRIVPDIGEYIPECGLKVNLVDPDGEVTFDISMPINVPEPVDGRGKKINCTFGLGAVEFGRPGRHEFVAWLEGDGVDDERQSIELDVSLMNPPPEALGLNDGAQGG